MLGLRTLLLLASLHAQITHNLSARTPDAKMHTLRLHSRVATSHRPQLAGTRKGAVPDKPTQKAPTDILQLAETNESQRTNSDLDKTRNETVYSYHKFSHSFAARQQETNGLIADTVVPNFAQLETASIIKTTDS